MAPGQGAHQVAAEEPGAAEDGHEAIAVHARDQGSGIRDQGSGIRDQ
jgi:hypothetical protein